MKTTRELQKLYPDCFKPIHRLKVKKLKTKKIIGYKNRPPLKEWWKKISKN